MCICVGGKGRDVNVLGIGNVCARGQGGMHVGGNRLDVVGGYEYGRGGF